MLIGGILLVICLLGTLGTSMWYLVHNGDIPRFIACTGILFTEIILTLIYIIIWLSLS